MKENTLKTLCVGMLGVNCSLVQLAGSRILYVIDPGGSVSEIIAAAKNFDYEEAVILLTHAHVDHISGAGAVARALNVRTVYLRPEDRGIYFSSSNAFPPALPAAENLPEPQWPPKDPAFQCLDCPGHTPGGVSYYFPELKTLFSGDTLFRDSIGRTDFPGGDLEQLLASIKEGLFALPDDTTVIPGHGDFTTIAYEKSNNPYV